MELDLTIHTYGYYDALYYVLNGIAMMRNSEFYTDLVNGLCILTGCYYAIKMSYSNNGSELKAYATKVLGMILLINALLLPKTEMILKDHVTKRIGKVDNIPMAFALPVGILEEFGHFITVGFEQVYAPIESAVNPSDSVFSYYNYGMLFGARLKKELRQVRIKDPEFVENMRSFIKQCVVLPAMIGYQFTPKQLIETNDIWQLVSQKAGTLTRLYIRENNEMKNVTCKDAAAFFERYFDEEVKRVVLKHENTEFAEAKGGETYGPRKTLKGLSSIFEKNIKALYGGSIKASDILRQQMMINSISDYRSSNYGVARARTSQESGWLLSSDMAGLYLPMLLVVIKCIVYASFIFLVPMLIFSGGITKYSSYITLVASLQLWPSLNAIINMIMGTYSNLKTGSNLMLSFSTASTVTNHVDTIVTVAAGLQMVVPFLAFALMQGGVIGLGHLAGSIIGGLQSTGGSIGGEVASGNRSIDNVYQGNRQYHNRSGYKTDYNMQHVEGGSSWQQLDGSMARVNPDGSKVFSSGPGITSSVGITKFNLEQSSQNQISQGIQESEALLKSDQRSLSTAKAKTFGSAVDFLSNIAQHEHSGQSFNYDTMGEQGKSLQQAINTTKALKGQHGYSWQQAADATLKASVTASTPLKGITGFGVSGSAEGSITARNVSDQALLEDSDVSRQNNTHEDFHNLIRAGSNINWAKDNNVDTSYSQALRSNYEEQQRLEEQVSMRQESLDNWHLAKNKLDSESASMSTDMYQEVLDRCVIEFGLDPNSVRKLIDGGDPDVGKVWNKIVSEKLQNVMPEISSGRQKVSGAESEKALNSFSTKHANSTNESADSRVEEAAARSGLNEELAANVHNSQEDLKAKFEKTTSKNTEQYSNVKQYNELEQRDLQKQVDKYEEDRIGQGKTAKAGAWLLNKVNAGENIGGPNKK